MAAVHTLWSRPTKEMIPVFRRLLDDPSMKNQEWAVGALRELGDPELTASMKARLASPDSRPLYVACEYLSVTGQSGMRDPILALLEHRDHCTRWWGISLLEAAGLTADARRLLPLLDDDSLGECAADTMVSLEAGHLVPDLKSLLKSPHLIVRQNALRALTGLGARGAAGPIRELLSDPDWNLRLTAIRSLGVLADKAAVPALCEFAKSDIPNFQWAALRALGQIGDPSAGPALLGVLRASDGSLRVSVAEAIGRTGYKEAVPELARLWRESGEHGSTVPDTLGALGARELIPEFLRRSQLDKCMGCLAGAFVALNVEEAKPLMKRTLEEYAKKDVTDESLASRLAELGDPSILLEYLKHADEEVRHRAATHLCELGDRRGVPEILKQAESRNRDLGILNAVRCAPEWKRLRKTRVPLWWRAMRCRHIERLGRLARLEVRWQGLDNFDVKAWSLETIRETRVGSEMDGCDGLSWMFKEGRPNICSEARRIDVVCSWILESGEIRVLPRADALGFWKQWWADEQAKKK
jgi:HEAT repeat protein